MTVAGAGHSPSPCSACASSARSATKRKPSSDGLANPYEKLKLRASNL